MGVMIITIFFVMRYMCVYVPGIYSNLIRAKLLYHLYFDNQKIFCFTYDI